MKTPELEHVPEMGTPAEVLSPKAPERARPRAVKNLKHRRNAKQRWCYSSLLAAVAGAQEDARQRGPHGKDSQPNP